MTGYADQALLESIESLAGSVQADSGIAVGVTVVGEPSRLTPPAGRALYSIFHQALANARRHAHCRRVRVVLDFEDDHEAVLVVRDDGIGLDIVEIDDTKHRGFAGMRRAAAEVRGSVTIATAVPSGAIITARVPNGVA